MNKEEYDFAGDLFREIEEIDKISEQSSQNDSTLTRTFSCGALLTIICC